MPSRRRGTPPKTTAKKTVTRKVTGHVGRGRPLGHRAGERDGEDHDVERQEDDQVHRPRRVLQLPHDRSQFIMSQSLPMLRQEFLSAQSANIQMVSGATYTSQAFVQSLQSALLKLRKSAARPASGARPRSRRARAGARSRRRPRRASATPPALPPCACAIVWTIASPSPLPGRGRASSARLKRSNARAREAAREARALVGHVQLEPVAAGRAESVTVAAAVDERVVDQVPERLLDAPRVGLEHDVVARVDLELAPELLGARREALGDGVEQLVRATPAPDGRGARPGRRARSAAGRRRAPSAGRSPRPPSGARPRAPPALRGWRSASSSSVRSSASGVRSSWLASATKRRSCSKAVSSRCEHLVQRLGEPGDLVLRGRHRQAAPGRRRRDRARLAPHRLDRPQRRAGEHVAGERRKQRARAASRRAAPCAGARATRRGRRASSRARARDAGPPVLPGSPSRRHRPFRPGTSTVGAASARGDRCAARRRSSSGAQPGRLRLDTAPRGASTWAKLTPVPASRSSGGRPRRAAASPRSPARAGSGRSSARSVEPTRR